MLRIGAYQFAVTGDIQQNFAAMRRAVAEAAAKRVQLPAFPECALTGYPPLKTASPDTIDFPLASECIRRLKILSRESGIHLLVGTVLKKSEKFYNSVAVISPDGTAPAPYQKRALWGWDAENFTAGNRGGVYNIEGYRVGVRICFEIRFPEYFRELFRAETDLNIVAFCDVSGSEDSERYALIKAHLMTRAVENVCPILSVNDISPHQTAPTAFFSKDGKVVAELPRGIEKMLVFDFETSGLSLGALGRKHISKRLAWPHSID